MKILFRRKWYEVPDHMIVLAIDGCGAVYAYSCEPWSSENTKFWWPDVDYGTVMNRAFYVCNVNPPRYPHNMLYDLV